MDKPHEEEASEEKLLKEIQELLTLKENYLAKIADAEIMDNKISEEVAKVRKDNTEQQDKTQILQQRIADLKRAEKHARFHEYGLIKDLQGKKELLAQFAQLCKPNFDMEASVAKFETASAELSKQLSEAPWLPEKRALMRQLNGRKDVLDNVLKEIAKMDEQIKEREQLLAQHEQLPFKKFCISLADYVHKSTNLKRMAKEEMQKAEDLAQQLKEQDEEEMALEGEEVNKNNDKTIELVQPRLALDAAQITQEAPVEERNNPEAIEVHNAPNQMEQDDGTGADETEQQEDQGEENVLDMEIDDQQEEVQEKNDDGGEDDDDGGDAVRVQILPKEDNNKNNQEQQYEETTMMSPLAAKKPQEREEDTFAIGGTDFLFGDADGNDPHNASGHHSTSFLGNDGAANDHQDGGGDFFSSLFDNDNADGQDNQNESFNFAGSFNFQPDSSNTGGGDNNNDFGFPFNFN